MIRRLVGNAAILLHLRLDRFVGSLVSSGRAMVRRSLLRIVQQRSISLILLGRGGRGTIVVVTAPRASRRVDKSAVR